MRSSWITALLTAAAIALVGANAASQEAHFRQAGETFRDCADCPEMVVVPSGSFHMGSSETETARDLKTVRPYDELRIVQEYMASEQPRHFVSIGQSFAMGKHRVTRGEFAAFVRETGYSIGGGCTLWFNHEYPVRPEAGWQNPGFAQTDRDPVVCVNWQDAKAYLAWLNAKLQPRMLGAGPYRLPSEAEWEYSARAGTRTARWWGDSIGSSKGNCDGCGSRWDRKQTAPADSFQPNPFGLLDMLGNAWQWMEDCWNETYAGAPEDGSAWTTGKCEFRVMRGGSWTNRPWVLRSSHRTRENPNIRANYIGFRVARALQ
jgi:formylglycine-generating enzyme required for sulfatase activity